MALLGLMLLMLSAPMFAAHDIKKIIIRGASLAAPIEMDEQIGRFFVWSGRGAWRNGVEETEGFIIDWPKGAVAAPAAGLQHFEVSFYEVDERPAYVVTYAFDPATNQGFVYLPGKGEDWYAVNTRSILRGKGVEGNWFMSSRAWDDFARPRIAKAKSGQ
jgi:hypothetical protein